MSTMLKKSFTADSNALMANVLENTYDSKRVYIRELVSNSFDAIWKKIHYIHKLAAEEQLKRFGNSNGVTNHFNGRVTITIGDAGQDVDKYGQYIQFDDNGIGMTFDELDQRLGTIANSGTREASNNASIGMFGVGFYTCLSIAKHVKVISRAVDCSSVNVWESSRSENGFGDYNVHTASEQDRKVFEGEHDSGTRIIIMIDKSTTRNNFYIYPPLVWKSLMRDIPFNSFPISLRLTSDPTQNGTLSQSRTLHEMVFMNDKNESRKIVSDAILSRVFMQCKKNDHFNATCANITPGTGIDTSAVIVCLVPEDMQMLTLNDEKRHGLNSFAKIYAKGVLVTEDCRNIVPHWLSFMYICIDVGNAQLSVSRHGLTNPDSSSINSNLSKQIVVTACRTLHDYAEKSVDTYVKNYSQISKCIKLGVQQTFNDKQSHNLLLSCLLFYSNQCVTESRSLVKYIESMPRDQQCIYYIICDSLIEAKSSPFTQVIEKHGYEVLYMIDPIDDYFMSNVKSFTFLKDYKLICLNDYHVGDNAFFGIPESLVPLESVDICAQVKFCSLVKNVITMSGAMNSDLVLVQSSEEMLSHSAMCVKSLKNSKFSPRLYRSVIYQAMASKKIIDTNAIIESISNHVNDGENNESSLVATAIERHACPKVLYINFKHAIIKKLMALTVQSQEFSNQIIALYCACSLISGFPLLNPSELYRAIENNCAIVE